MVTVITLTDVNENVNCQAEKELEVEMPTQTDDVEFKSVLDVDSTKFLMLTKPCWCKSVVILDMKVFRKPVSFN